MFKLIGLFAIVAVASAGYSGNQAALPLHSAPATSYQNIHQHHGAATPITHASPAHAAPIIHSAPIVSHDGLQPLLHSSHSLHSAPSLHSVPLDQGHNLHGLHGHH